MGILNPDMVYRRASDISLSDLRSRGISVLLLDLDGTLCHIKGDTPPDDISLWLSSLIDAGFTLAVVSNNKHPERVERFCKNTGIHHCINRAGKPFQKGFKWAVDTLGVSASQTAVIGDQIYTDVLGANIAGMTSIFVYSFDYTIWYVGLRHIAEKPFIGKITNGGKK